VAGRRTATAGAFPYVIFWTDYSAGRKTPLEVTTLFAHTESRAEALIKKLLAENVTKGFERADVPKPVAVAAAVSAPEEAKPADAPKPKRAARKKAAE
jgi:hypothetical protein